MVNVGVVVMKLCKNRCCGYYLKITSYANELLEDLKKLKDHWPNQVITMQENWIGKSDGLNRNLSLIKRAKNFSSGIDGFSVFTTRPDTIYGMSHTALAPEHEVVKETFR